MPLIFTAQTGAALLIGLIIGISIGFALGAWWLALRTEKRAIRSIPDARAYHGEYPIRDHRTLADIPPMPHRDGPGS